jgi:hypothetical protein
MSDRKKHLQFLRLHIMDQKAADELRIREKWIW